MEDLLILEAASDMQETIDVLHGGFDLLSDAVDDRRRASVAELQDRQTEGIQRSVLGKFTRFWEWFMDNEGVVNVVFDEINLKAEKLFADKSVNPTNAIQNVQKDKVLGMEGKRSHENMYVRVQERANRMAIAEKKTIDAHEMWKSRGFEDLTAGAMKWKKLLRELKGELGIWESGGGGGGGAGTKSDTDTDTETSASTEKLRWKLDLR